MKTTKTFEYIIIVYFLKKLTTFLSKKYQIDFKILPMYLLNLKQNIEIIIYIIYKGEFKKFLDHS